MLRKNLPEIKAILAATPVKKDQNLPVNVKKDLIKELYGSIAERIFGFDPSYIRWMHQTIDSIMSDRDVEREWEFIKKGNVEKLLKLMQQIQMQAGEDDAPELEQLEQIWNEVAEGIIKTKQANQEIDDTTWDVVEKNLMQFVDKFSDKLSKKSLPSTEKKLLKSSIHNKHNKYETNNLYKEGTWVEPWDLKDKEGLYYWNDIAVEVIDEDKEGWVKIIAIDKKLKSQVSAKLLAKKIKTATEADVETLSRLDKEFRSLSKKIGKLVNQAEGFMTIPNKFFSLSSDILLFAHEIDKAKNTLEKEIKEKAEEKKEVTAASGDMKSLEKEAIGWELKLDPIYDQAEDMVVGYELSTFSDPSVGLYALHVGDFTAEGFKANPLKFEEFLKELDIEDQNGFELFIQSMEEKIKDIILGE